MLNWLVRNCWFQIPFFIVPKKTKSMPYWSLCRKCNLGQDTWLDFYLCYTWSLFHFSDEKGCLFHETYRNLILYQNVFFAICKQTTPIWCGATANDAFKCERATIFGGFKGDNNNLEKDAPSVEESLAIERMPMSRVVWLRP